MDPRRYISGVKHRQSVRVWEVATGTCVRVILNAISVTCVAWSPCGNLLLTSAKGDFFVYNLGGGRLAPSTAVETGFWYDMETIFMLGM